MAMPQMSQEASPPVEELSLIAERIMGFVHHDWQPHLKMRSCSKCGAMSATSLIDRFPYCNYPSRFDPRNSDADMAGLLRKLMEEYDLTIVNRGRRKYVTVREHGFAIGTPRIGYGEANELRDAVYLAALELVKTSKNQHAKQA